MTAFVGLLTTAKPGILLGSSTDARRVILESRSTYHGSLVIRFEGRKIAARLFAYTSLAPSSYAVAWLAAAVDGNLKMVQIIVTVSRGNAYAYASEAGYTTADSFTTETLSDGIVNNAFNSRMIRLKHNSTWKSYEVENLQYEILSTTAQPPSSSPRLFSSVPTAQPFSFKRFLPKTSSSDAHHDGQSSDIVSISIPTSRRLRSRYNTGD